MIRPIDFKTIKKEETYWIKLYLSGPIEVAKQTIRKFCLGVGLCVTIEPTTFIYTGGEESGYVVGLVNYPRFPVPEHRLMEIAEHLACRLIEDTYQNSVMIMTPTVTKWLSMKD